jgi:hypothetical protein
VREGWCHGGDGGAHKLVNVLLDNLLQQSQQAKSRYRNAVGVPIERIIEVATGEARLRVELRVVHTTRRTQSCAAAMSSAMSSRTE